MKDLGLKVETLEELLHVISPLGTRVNIDQICRGCELELSRILLTVDLRFMDMSKFDVSLGMDWLTAHRVVIDYDRIRTFFPDKLLGLPPHRVVDFTIELHPGTSPISMTRHRMAYAKLQELD